MKKINKYKVTHPKALRLLMWKEDTHSKVGELMSQGRTQRKGWLVTLLRFCPQSRRPLTTDHRSLQNSASFPRPGRVCFPLLLLFQFGVLEVGGNTVWGHTIAQGCGGTSLRWNHYIITFSPISHLCVRLEVTCMNRETDSPHWHLDGRKRFILIKTFLIFNFFK